MKTNYDNNELSPEALNELNQLCGGGYRQANRIQDDFGIDDSWLESFIEDYNIGG
jgi:hypothetical protein